MEVGCCGGGVMGDITPSETTKGGYEVEMYSSHGPVYTTLLDEGESNE